MTDVRGPLAIMSLLGVFAYNFVLLWLNHGTQVDPPAWMVALVALIVGHYFGAKNEVAMRDKARDKVHDDKQNA